MDFRVGSKKWGSPTHPDVHLHNLVSSHQPSPTSHLAPSRSLAATGHCFSTLVLDCFQSSHGLWIARFRSCRQYWRIAYGRRKHLRKTFPHSLFVGTQGHELRTTLKWECDIMTCQYAHTLIANHESPRVIHSIENQDFCPWPSLPFDFQAA